MNKNTKFQIDWQIVRARAKRTNGIDNKLMIVETFLRENNTEANFKRVLNWVRMIEYSYKDSSTKEKIRECRKMIENVSLVCADSDANVFEKYTIEELKALYKELSNRKYNFQFKGKSPKDHDMFISELNQYIQAVETA